MDNGLVQDGQQTADSIDNGSFSGCNPIDSLTLDQYNFDCSHIGNNPVVLTAWNLNNKDTASAIVTVVNPYPEPEVITKDITITKFSITNLNSLIF